MRVITETKIPSEDRFPHRKRKSFSQLSFEVRRTKRAVKSFVIDNGRRNRRNDNGATITGSRKRIERTRRDENLQKIDDRPASSRWTDGQIKFADVSCKLACIVRTKKKLLASAIWLRDRTANEPRYRSREIRINRRTKRCFTRRLKLNFWY